MIFDIFKIDTRFHRIKSKICKVIISEMFGCVFLFENVVKMYVKLRMEVAAVTIFG